MAVLKPATTVLGPIAVAAGATTALGACIATDLTKATQCVVTFRGTFHASATAGARITVWPSFDGTNWDTEPWANMEGVPVEWTIAVRAGQAVIRTSEPLSPTPKFLRIRVQNLDTIQVVAGVSVVVTVQTAG